MNIQDQLMPHESLIVEIKPHWIIFARSVFWLCFTVAMLLLGPHYVVTRLNLLPNIPVYKIIAFISLCMVLITAIPAYVQYVFWEFAITSKRLILKRSLIQRKITEIMLQRIESINVDQSVMGRLLDYGSLEINGIGGSKDVFVNYPKPLQLRNMIAAQMEKAAGFDMNAPK